MIYGHHLIINFIINLIKKLIYNYIQFSNNQKNQYYQKSGLD